MSLGCRQGPFLFVTVQCHSWALDDGEVACWEGWRMRVIAVRRDNLAVSFCSGVFYVVPLNESSLVMEPVS